MTKPESSAVWIVSYRQSRLPVSPLQASVLGAENCRNSFREWLEFLKRLCSSRHGVYAQGVPTPIAGDVHVYGVGPKGRVCQYPKIRQQTQVLMKERP